MADLLLLAEIAVWLGVVVLGFVLGVLLHVQAEREERHG